MVSKLFFVCMVLIALSFNGLVVRADETGECVVSSDGETCVDPDAAAAAADAAASKPVAAEAEAEPEQVEEEPIYDEDVPGAEDDASEEVPEAPDTTPEQEESTTDAQVEPDEAPADEPVEIDAKEPVEPEAEEVPEEAEKSEEVTVVEENAAPESAANESEDEENTPNCPSRKHVIKCARQYLDTNNNSLLERSELQAAIDALPWLSRGILTILGSVDKMMKKCDVDGDDAIGMDYDMEHNSEICLATCFKRRAFKAAFFPDCTA